MTPFSMINARAEELSKIMNKNTAIAYNRVWRDFSEYLDHEEVHDFDDMTKAHIMKFLSKFRMKPFSYNQARSAIFKILYDVIDVYNVNIEKIDNIKHNVKSKKVKSDNKLFLNNKELMEARDSAYILFMDRAVRERNLLIFDLLRHTMMRVDEVALIQLDDIQLHAKRLAVRGKGSAGDASGARAVNALIPLTDHLMESIQSYVRSWRKPAKTDDVKPYLEHPRTLHANMPLFTSRIGNPLNVSTIKKDIGKMIESLYEHGTVPKNHGAHCIRRSVATLKYRQTKDLILIQQMLRHASPETTRRYLSIDQEALDQAFLQELT